MKHVPLSEFKASDDTLVLILLLFLSFQDDGQRILEEASIRYMKEWGWI